MTSHLDESIMMGILAMSGSEATKFKKYFMAFSASSMPSSILISMICAPFSTWCRATDSASSYFSLIIKFANTFEPVTFVRSPTFTNKESSLIKNDSSPESLVTVSTFGISRGLIFCISSTIALICSGVVPQHPPAILTKPLIAKSLSKDEVSLGVSSKPVSDIGLGKPALG